MEDSNFRTKRRLRIPMRESLILVGFILLIMAALVTVVMPELGEEPEPEGSLTTTQDESAK